MFEALEAIDPTQPCWVGKTPAQGDFISGNLTPKSEKQLLDEMTRELLGAAENFSQNDWIETYLMSPLWHLLISRVRGDEIVYLPCLIIPSIDTANRLYPLLVAMPWCDRSEIAQRFLALYASLAEVYPLELLPMHPNTILKRQVCAIHETDTNTEIQLPAQLFQDDPVDSEADLWYWVVDGDKVGPFHHLEGEQSAGLFYRIFPRPKEDELASHEKEVI